MRLWRTYILQNGTGTNRRGCLRRISVLCLLTACILLSGCGNGWRNYIYTDASLKRTAEKSLKEKYGEEFVIHSVWEKNSSQFFAYCSPKDDLEVVFRADIEKNGDGVADDGYTQSIVAKELNELLRDDFRMMFPDCYTRVRNPSYYNVPQFENPQEVTLEEYSPYIDFGFMGYYVYISEGTIGSSVENEYNYFQNTIGQRIKNKSIPDIVINMYFVDEDMMKQCGEYYHASCSTDSTFQSLLDKYVAIRFGYLDGNINITFEDYLEMRRKVGNE